MTSRSTKFFTALFLATLMLGCTQDSTVSDETTNQTDSEPVTLVREQEAIAAFDTSSQGLYQGLFLAGYSNDRGKIWINAGNDGTYTAEVELVDGRTFAYRQVGAPTQKDNPIQYFVSDADSSFYLDLSDYNNPVVLDAKIGTEMYMGVVFKKTSQRAPVSITGTYQETGNPSFAGSWNFISDGSNPDPNGNFSVSEALTEVIITDNNGNMYTDSGPFETDAGCASQFIPVVVEFFSVQAAYASRQISNFTPVTQTDWTLEGSNNGTNESYAADLGSGCVTVSSGIFTHTWQSQVRNGEIYID